MISKNDWESKFFKKEIFKLEFDGKIDELKTDLRNNNWDLVECNVNLTNFKDILMLQNLGFKIVDSRIRFLTNIEFNQQDYLFYNEDYTIRNYLEKDLDFILNLTQEFLTNNKNFISRFKNESYFNVDDGEKYFTKWINFSLANPNSKTAVVEKDNKQVGFFIMEEKGVHKEIPLLKGILTAVDKNNRGNKLHLVLQTFLFENFGYKSFYLDNTTQLSNIAVIKNHIKSSRKLDSMHITMYLDKKGFK